MIKSMTGFGRSELVTEFSRIAVEIRAVNHRYCDLNIRMPRKLNYLEPDIRNYLKKEISRGKVDVFISYEDLSDRSSAVIVNQGLAKGYYQAVRSLAGELGLSDQISGWQISRFPDVVSVEDLPVDQERVKEELLTAVEEACGQFVESRIREGEALRQDIRSKLDWMEDNMTVIEERYPEMVAAYRKRLEDKVSELLADTALDESRIAAEVVIYADKISVDEETVRLRSHIRAMGQELDRGGAVGRKLDFIAQEMNREANTILSKANDQTISGHAIAYKTEIEKIREQVQNIE